jgi:hypothetical protein
VPHKSLLSRLSSFNSLKILDKTHKTQRYQPSEFPRYFNCLILLWILSFMLYEFINIWIQSWFQVNHYPLSRQLFLK